MSQQVQMTPEQAVAFLKNQAEQIKRGLEVNRKMFTSISSAHKELHESLPASMSNIPQVVTAIARGVDSLLTAQMDQMELIIKGQEADIAAAKAKVEEIQSPSRIVRPGRMGV